MILKRNISKTMLEIVNQYPILAVTGPRQSGKTTLLKELFSDFKYISLENPDNREFAKEDPNGFLKRFSGKVIIDEAQRVPSIFSYLQTHVDSKKEMGQYIVSGSQNFHLMQEITQSLAGRVAIFKLFPFDFNELKESDLLSRDYLQNIIKGFYPALYDRKIKSQTFFSNYIQTYLQRDVSELIEIRDMNTFKDFLFLLATRAGQLLNMNAISKECRITQPTVKSWISALENSFIIFRLHPFYKNLKKRVVKSSKLYFYDTGLLSYLLRLKNIEELYTNPVKGTLFENMIISEYIKQMYHSNELNDFWFWRDTSGHEVDLLYHNGMELTATEIKATNTISKKHFEGLNYFEKLLKNIKVKKELVYSGQENMQRQGVEITGWDKIGM